MTQYFTHQSFAEWPYLLRVRTESEQRCKQLSAALADFELVEKHVLTLFAVGSAGRLELGEASDLDGVVVLKGPLCESTTNTLMDGIEARYRECGFEVAKASGIYRQPILLEQLLDATQRGQLDEAPSVYGKRIQALLDARPLYGEARFNQLQLDVLRWFCPSSYPTEAKYQYFLIELKRYFHAYSAWQNFKFDKSADDGWLLRQAKLRVTRMVTIAATILLIGAASDKNKAFDFESYLSATPVERVRGIFLLYEESHAAREFLTHYEHAVQMMNDAEVRYDLVSHSPANVDQINYDVPDSYKCLQEISQELATIITAFILERRCDWSQAFYRDCLL